MTDLFEQLLHFFILSLRLVQNEDATGVRILPDRRRNDKTGIETLF